MNVERATRTPNAGLSYAWLAGIVDVLALVAESAVGTGGDSLTASDWPAKIARRVLVGYPGQSGGCATLLA